MEITLTLPFPPTQNHLYKHTRAGHHYLTEKGRVYYAQVNHLVLAQEIAFGDLEKLDVSILVHAPDNRRRDLDNMLKAILDSLTKACLWADDSQIDRLSITRGSVALHQGHVIVHVKSI